MLTNGVLTPWKVALCLLGVLYGILLGMKLPSAGLIITIGIVLVSAALWYIANRGYSLWTLMPAITGVVVLLSCVAALYTGFPQSSFLPVTRTSIELWLMVLVALGYIGWGVYEARRAEMM